MGVDRMGDTASDGQGLMRPGVARARASARDVLTLLFREWRLMVWVGLGLMVCGAAVAFMMPITWTASNRLLVLSGQEYLLRPEASVNLPPLSMDQNQVVHTEIEIFNSAMLIEQVIERIGVEQLYPEIVQLSSASGAVMRVFAFLKQGLFGAEADPAGSGGTGPSPAAIADDPEAAIAASSRDLQALRRQRMAIDLAVFVFRQNVKVLPIKDANVIEFAFTHRDPVLAAQALNLLQEEGMNYRRQLLSRTRPQQFSEQRDAFRTRLEVIESQIEQFKQRHNISSFAEERTLLLRQHTDMVGVRQTTEARAAEVVAQLAVLREAIAGVPEQISLYRESNTQDANDTARSTLVSLEMRRNELLAKFKEDSRFIQDIDLQIHDLRNIVTKTPPKISDSSRTGRNPLFDDLRARIVNAESEDSALRRRLDTLRAQEREIARRLASFDEAESQYNALMREHELVNQNFKTHAQNAEMAAIQSEQERQKSANIRVIEEARPPTRANNMRSMILVLSAMVSVSGALIAVFLVDFFRNTALTPEAAERALGLPVLVAVPLKEASPMKSAAPGLGRMPPRVATG